MIKWSLVGARQVGKTLANPQHRFSTCLASCLMDETLAIPQHPIAACLAQLFGQVYGLPGMWARRLEKCLPVCRR